MAARKNKDGLSGGSLVSYREHNKIMNAKRKKAAKEAAAKATASAEVKTEDSAE